MSQPQEEGLQVIAQVLNDTLPKIYGVQMGFFLVVTPYDTEKPVCDYIGNAHREDAIEWLRETADRLEAGKDIPVTEGEA